MGYIARLQVGDADTPAAPVGKLGNEEIASLVGIQSRQNLIETGLCRFLGRLQVGCVGGGIQ